MKKNNTRILKYIVSGIIVASILGLIPVKRAINSKYYDFNSIKLLDTETWFIVEPCQVTNAEWYVVKAKDIAYQSKDVYISKMIGDTPFSGFNLNSDFSYDITSTPNKYLLIGDVVKKNDIHTTQVEIEYRVRKWYPIYPIQRYSIRGRYLSESYQTIYDYKLFELFIRLIRWTGD